jgi:hypothetical protein
VSWTIKLLTAGAILTPEQHGWKVLQGTLLVVLTILLMLEWHVAEVRLDWASRLRLYGRITWWDKMFLAGRVLLGRVGFPLTGALPGG